MDVEFGIVDRALGSLRAALAQPPKNDLERDGVIQRFEYSFELVWKIAKRVLNKSGINSTSPRSVIRDLALHGYLVNAEQWMMMLEARNYTSHTYNESVANWVFSQCASFLSAADDLVSKLKSEIGK